MEDLDNERSDCMTHDVQITTMAPVNDSETEVLEVSIRGFLDTMAAYSLQERVHQRISEGQYWYIINLQDLDHISSAGIGFFSGLALELRRHQGEVVFLHVPEHVRHVFTITRLSEIFTICDDAASALRVMTQARQSMLCG